MIKLNSLGHFQMSFQCSQSLVCESLRRCTWGLKTFNLVLIYFSNFVFEPNLYLCSLAGKSESGVNCIQFMLKMNSVVAWSSFCKSVGTDFLLKIFYFCIIIFRQERLIKQMSMNSFFQDAVWIKNWIWKITSHLTTKTTNWLRLRKVLNPSS